MVGSGIRIGRVAYEPAAARDITATANGTSAGKEHFVHSTGLLIHHSLAERKGHGRWRSGADGQCDGNREGAVGGSGGRDHDRAVVSPGRQTRCHDAGG